MATSWDYMSEKDQRHKLRKRQEIERNWRCDMQESIPAKVRPRQGSSPRNTVKAKIGSNAPEAPWWQWSVDLLYKLEQLSSMTMGKLVFAQKLMILEVTKRQVDYTSNRREVAELIRGDLERIIGDLQQRVIDPADEEEEEGEEEEEYSDEDESDEVDAEEGDGVQPDDVLIKDEQSDGDIEMITEDPAQLQTAATTIKCETEGDETHKMTMALTPTSTTMPSSVTPFMSRGTLKIKAKIASLRADAMRLTQESMRLRQEAARREAKAYELEAKALKTAARKMGWTRSCSRS